MHVSACISSDNEKTQSYQYGSWLSGVAFSLGVALVASIAFTMLLSGSLLFFGVTPRASFLLVGAALGIVTALSVTPQAMRSGRFIISLVAAFLLTVIVCTLVSSFFYDVSWDGNAYHKQGVVALSLGWNPLQESSSKWLLPKGSALWTDHYCHGLYFVQACFYQLTGNVESAKATTLLMVCAVIGMLWGYLSAKGLSSPNALLVGLIAAVNPITLAQFCTFYVDAFLMMSLFTLIAGLAMVIDSEVDFFPRAVILVVSGILLCSCTKFSGIGFAGVFCLSFGMVGLYAWRKHGLIGKRRFFIAMACCVIAFVAAVLIVDYSSYVRNYTEHGHPFYPIAGEGAIDIISGYVPDGLKGKPDIKVFVYSLLGEAGKANIKWPFIITANEAAMFDLPDVKVSGFGPLYGTATLLSIPLIVAMLVWSWHESSGLLRVSIATIVPIIGLIVVLPGSWWPRYISYEYAVNVLILVFLSLALKKSPHASSRGFRLACGKAVTCIGILFLGVLVSNCMCWISWRVFPQVAQSREIDREIAKIQEHQSADGLAIEVEYDRLPGLLYAFEDRGIRYMVLPDGSIDSPDGAIAKNRGSKIEYRFAAQS